MNKKVDYNYNDYAIILPDGMILFGSTMFDFILGVTENEEQANDFMWFFREIADGNSKNHFIDVGDGTKVEIVKRCELQLSTNPAICN